MTSNYSGNLIPVNNTIVPEVNLSNPNAGTEGSSLELTLKNTTAGVEYCHDATEDTNHALYRVQVNIHSPNMYSQLGNYTFTLRLTFYSPESLQLTNSLQYETDTYTVFVDVITGSMFVG